MDKEIKTPEEVTRWNLVNPPKQKKLLHKKYVLRRVRSAADKISKHKARYEEHNDDEVSSPVTDFTVVELILCRITGVSKWETR